MGKHPRPIEILKLHREHTPLNAALFVGGKSAHRPLISFAPAQVNDWLRLLYYIFGRPGCPIGRKCTLDEIDQEVGSSLTK